MSARFETVGLVLYPWDLEGAGWVERAASAGVCRIGLHAARKLDVLAGFVKSDPGLAFLEACNRRGIDVEYELHAMGDLLSRELFYHDPELFRVDDFGNRNPDANCCPSSSRGLEIISEKAIEFARVLAPSSGRYYYWPDDGKDWCHCRACCEHSASDQAVIVENAIVTALRKSVDPDARLCHIAYQQTLFPPELIAPHEALFVEFAPIGRDSNRVISDRIGVEAEDDTRSNFAYLDALHANLELFGTESAEVLEYWLDVSRDSRWKRPVRKLCLDLEVIDADAKAYRDQGIRHVKRFATWVDADYIERFGEPPVDEFVASLQGR